MAQTRRKVNRKVKPFADLSPATQRRYLAVLGVDSPTQADRILRDMQRRGVTRKRLSGKAPSLRAKRPKTAKTGRTPTIPIGTLRRKAAEHIAAELERPDALVMLTLHSTVFDRPSALRALKMNEEDIRSAAAGPADSEIEGIGLVNPFWYHPTAYAY